MSRYKVQRTKGIKFLFKFDEAAPDLLHIYARHLTTPRDAIATFFEGDKLTGTSNFSALRLTHQAIACTGFGSIKTKT